MWRFVLAYCVSALFPAGQNIKRESGRKVQTGNINAAKVSQWKQTGETSDASI